MAYASLADFKEFTKITDTSSARDTAITNFIAIAEEIVNDYTNVQTFESSSVTTIFNDEWQYDTWLYLPVIQCESITSITLKDRADGTTQDTLASDKYYLEKSKARILNLYGSIKTLEITVVYAANNGGVPVDIKQATLEIARRIFNDSNYGLGIFDMDSKEVADETLSVFNKDRIPSTAKLILDRKKRCYGLV